MSPLPFSIPLTKRTFRLQAQTADWGLDMLLTGLTVPVLVRYGGYAVALGVDSDFAAGTDDYEVVFEGLGGVADAACFVVV